MLSKPLPVILKEINLAIQWKQYHPTVKEKGFLEEMAKLFQAQGQASLMQARWLLQIHNKVFRTQKSEATYDQLRDRESLPR